MKVLIVNMYLSILGISMKKLMQLNGADIQKVD